MNPPRYLTYLTVLSTLLVSLPLMAQDSTAYLTRPALLKTNVAGPFTLLLEVPLSPRRSVQLGVHGSSFGVLSNVARFFSITPEFRFYLSKSVASRRRPAPKGFYVGPYLKYRTVADEKSGFFNGRKLTTVYYSMLGGGVAAGGQLITRRGLTLDAFLGVGYYPWMKYRTSLEDPYANPFDPASPYNPYDPIFAPPRPEAAGLPP